MTFRHPAGASAQTCVFAGRSCLSGEDGLSPVRKEEG